MHRQGAVAAAAVLAAIIVGCGGGAGDSGSTGGEASKNGGHQSSTRAETTATTTKSVTKTNPKFLAQANSLCRRKWRFVLNAVRQTAVLWAKQYPRVDERQNFLRAVHLSYFASINYVVFDWIRRLGAPPGQAQAVEDVIETMQEAVERGERGVPVTSVAQVKGLFADYNRKASRYGLDKCLVAGGHLPHPEA